MAYKISTTLKKGALPLIVIILAQAIIAAAKASGIAIDDTTAWSIAAAGYGAVIAFINWLKNHKKKPVAAGPSTDPMK